MAGNVVNIAVKTTGAQATAKSFDQIGQKARAIGLAMTAMGAGISLLATKITEANRNLVAQTGFQGEQLDALADSFRKVAGTVPQDMRDVANAVGAVSTELGLTGTDLQETTRMFLDLSRITGVELEPMLKQTADAMDAFGIASTESRTTMDKFLRASQDTGVGMGRLSQRMQEFGPIFSNLNMDFDSTLAFMSSMEGAGISLSRIMPALNASMRRMSESGIEDLKVGMNDVIVAVRDATTFTEGMNIATDTFGSEGAQRITFAIRDGVIPELTAMSSALGDSHGAVEDLTEGTDTLAESLKEMTNRLQISLAPYNELLEVLGPVLAVVGTLAMSFLAIAKFASIALAVVKVVAVGVGIAIGAIVGAPLLLVAIVVLAVIAVTALIVQHFDKFVEGLKNIWEGGVKKMVEGAKEFGLGLYHLLMDILSFDWDGIKENFVRMMKGLYTLAQGLVESIGQLLIEFINIFSYLFSLLPNPIKEAFYSVMRFIVDGLNVIIRAINSVLGLLAKLPDRFGGDFFRGLQMDEIRQNSFRTHEATGRMLTDANIGQQAGDFLGTGAIINNVTVEMYGNNYGFDDFDEAIATSVNRGLNNGGYNGFAPKRTVEFDGA